MSFVILGDETYPPKTYLMKPFARKDLSCEEPVFNYRLSRARRCVERAFGILTVKWRLLDKAIETKANKAERTVSCICLLHNVIIDLERTTHYLLFFKKLHKFMDPVRPEQMSVVDNSIGPQKEQLM
jgi:hypothetical protein